MREEVVASDEAGAVLVPARVDRVHRRVLAEWVEDVEPAVHELQRRHERPPRVEEVRAQKGRERRARLRRGRRRVGARAQRAAKVEGVLLQHFVHELLCVLQKMRLELIHCISGEPGVQHTPVARVHGRIDGLRDPGAHGIVHALTGEVFGSAKDLAAVVVPSEHPSYVSALDAHRLVHFASRNGKVLAHQVIVLELILEKLHTTGIVVAGCCHGAVSFFVPTHIASSASGWGFMIFAKRISPQVDVVRICVRFRRRVRAGLARCHA